MKQYKYFAFISYSRRDSDTAKWYHNKLEHFHVPTKLPPLPDGEPIPKPLRFFRDKTDLNVSSDTFTADLKQAVADSQFLVVLCSPNAAQSNPDGRHYIDWEINEFIEIHGKDYALTHILPVVIDGVICSGNPETECMPPALRDLGDEFLQHNFPILEKSGGRQEMESSKNVFVMQTLSFLLSMDYNVLNDRYQREQKKRTHILLSVISAILAVFVFLTVLAVHEGNIAKKQLAVSDMQEGTLLLDHKEPDSALAYFSSGLKAYDDRQNLQYVYNVITQRSWLVEKKSDEKIPYLKKIIWYQDKMYPAIESYTGQSPYTLEYGENGKTVSVKSKNGLGNGCTIILSEGYEWDSFMLSDDGNLLISVQKTNNDFKILVSDAQTGKTVKEFSDEGLLLDAALSPDGTYIAWCCVHHATSGIYSLYIERVDGKNGSWSATLADFKRLLFSPDSIHIMIDSENQEPGLLSLIDVYRPEFMQYSVSLGAPVTKWKFSHDGRKLAVITADNALCVVSVRSGSELVERRHLNSSMVDVAFTEDDRSVLVKTSDGTRCFGIQICPSEDTFDIRPPKPFSISAGCMNKSGKAAMLITRTMNENRLQMRNTSDTVADTGDYIKLDGIPSNAMVCTAISPDDSAVALAVLGDGDSTVFLYDTKPDLYKPSHWKEPVQLSSVPVTASAMKFSSDGRKLLIMPSASSGYSAVVIDMKTKQQTELKHDDGITACDFLDTKKVVMLRDNDTVEIWDADTGSCLLQNKLDIGIGFLSCVAVSPDGKIACGIQASQNVTGSIILLDKNGKVIRQITKLQSSVTHVCFNKTGKLLGVSYKSGATQVIEVKTGIMRSDPMMQGKKSGSRINGISFMENGSDGYLVTCGAQEDPDNSGFSEVWDFIQAKRIAETEVYDAPVSNIWTYPEGMIAVLSNEELKLMSFSMRSGVGLISKDDAAVLGGMRLNKFGIPDYISGTGSVKSDSALMRWLSDFSDKRTVNPGSKEPMSSYLAVLSNSGSESIENALDIDPQYLPALDEYWFDTAFQIVEESPEVKQRNPDLSSSFWPLFVNNPEAVKSADFITARTLLMHSRSHEACNERAHFLYVTGKKTEADELIQTSLELAPDDVKTVCLAVDFASDRNEKFEWYKKGADIIDKSSIPVKDLCSFSNDYLTLWCSTYGMDGTHEKINWFLSQLKKNMPAEMTFSEQSAVLQMYQKVDQILLYIPGGADEAEKLISAISLMFANNRSVQENTKTTLELDRGYTDLFIKKYDEAEQILSRYKNDPIIGLQVQVNLAHCLSFEGKNDEAMALYKTVLENDAAYQYLLSKSIISDFCLFRMMGTPVPCEAVVKNAALSQARRNTAFAPAITTVYNGGQGKAIGLQAGDRISYYDGYPVFCEEFMYTYSTEKFRTGATNHELVIRRNGKMLKFRVSSEPLGIEFQPAVEH